MGSGSLGFIRICLMVVLPLKCTCIPYLLHMCFILSAVPLVYGRTIWPKVFLVVLALVPVLLGLLLLMLPLSSSFVLLLLLSEPLVSSQLLLITLFWTLLMAQLGYLHLPRASLRCFNSSLRSSGVVQTTLALWVSVPMTLYLEDTLWWLSHCKYWSVWVGFQYTWKERELSARGVTRVSRKGIAPFAWFPSTVNLIAGSMLLIWSRNPCLCACCWMTQVSSTKLNHAWGVNSRCNSFSFKTFHVLVSYYGTYRRSHRHSFYPFIKLVLERKVCIMQTEPK